MSAPQGAGAPESTFNELLAELALLAECSESTLATIRGFFNENPVLNIAQVDHGPAAGGLASQLTINRKPSDSLIRTATAARASYEKGCSLCRRKTTHESSPELIEECVFILTKWFGNHGEQSRVFYRGIVKEILGQYRDEVITAVIIDFFENRYGQYPSVLPAEAAHLTQKIIQSCLQTKAQQTEQ